MFSLFSFVWLQKRYRKYLGKILNEMNPEYSLEGLMLQLKFQYFGHLMQRANSLEKTLMLRKIEDRRRGGGSEWDDWMVSPTQWTWIWASSKRWWRTEKPGCCSPWGREESVTSEQLNNRSISLDLPLFVLTPRTMYRHCLMLSKVIYHDPLLFNGLLILNFSNYSSWHRSLCPFFYFTTSCSYLIIEFLFLKAKSSRTKGILHK